jgi:predicted carbohydrate-binding protein with CBM5 and CBM33 domain
LAALWTSVVEGSIAARAYNADMEAGFQCAGCGEWNETSVDESAGTNQSYIEDCQVCCKPNLLRAAYDSLTESYLIHADLE